MKKIKKIVGAIVLAILFIGASPWFLTVVIGLVVGGFTQSFFLGFKRGAVGVDNFSMKFRTIQLQQEMDKLKKVEK